MRVGEALKILLSLKKKKKDEKQILCFRTKTAHIEQSLFDPIGPFSYVLSHIIFTSRQVEGEDEVGTLHTRLSIGLRKIAHYVKNQRLCMNGN